MGEGAQHGGACQTRTRQPCFAAKFKHPRLRGRQKVSRPKNKWKNGSGRVGERHAVYVAKIIPRGSCSTLLARKPRAHFWKREGWVILEKERERKKKKKDEEASGRSVHRSLTRAAAAPVVPVAKMNFRHTCSGVSVRDSIYNNNMPILNFLYRAARHRSL